MFINDILPRSLSGSEIQKIKKIGAAFALGAVCYSCAEILWRGHTHWTMAITGGACTAMIHLMNRRMKEKSLALRCLCGCGIITASELCVGLLVNRLLGWDVWDYSDMRFNLFGQVCLLYCGMWYILSLPAIVLSNRLDMPKKKAMIFGNQ